MSIRVLLDMGEKDLLELGHHARTLGITTDDLVNLLVRVYLKSPDLFESGINENIISDEEDDSEEDEQDVVKQFLTLEGTWVNRGEN